MSPILLFPIALLTPVMLCVSLLLPPYIALFAACYAIYASAAPAQLPTLAAHWGDPAYILQVYGQLFTYWRAHMAEASIVGYTAPLLSLPVVGAIVAQWLTRRVVRKLVHIFHMANPS
ncbi:MAG: hypothetical protein ACKVOE_00330 [Rickettsiales bacterium]